MLKEIQVYDVCGLSSSTSWPQDKDASPSKLFGRWPREAWTAQWRSETGKGRQPIKGELSNSLYSGRLKLHPTGALWETGWCTPQNYPNWGVRDCGIYPPVSICQCVRAALSGALMSSTLVPVPRWSSGLQSNGARKPSDIVAVGRYQSAYLGAHGHQHQQWLWGFDFQVTLYTSIPQTTR